MKQTFVLPALVLILLCLHLQTAQARWEITPRIRAAESWSDNVSFSGNDEEDDDFITEINPGISVLKEEGRLQVDLDYEMQNVFYASNSSSNTTFHNLDALGILEVIRSRFFIDFDAQADQSIIDARRRISVRSIHNTGNITDVYRVAITPRWVQPFGRIAIGEASYRYGITEFDEETDEGSMNGDIDDNTLTQAVLSLNNFYPDADLTWGMSYQRSHVDYEDRSNVTFERAQADLGYRVLYPLRIVGTYGIENNDFVENGTTDDPDDTFWNAGFIYDFNPRSQLEARYGERFFGNTYFARWDYAGPRLELLAQYKEDITTQGIKTPLLGGPVIVKPTQVDTNVSNERTGVFELNSYELRAALSLSKSVYSVFFSHEDREFLSSFNEEEETRFHLVWDWEIGSVSSLTSGGYWQRQDSSLGGNNQDTYNFRVEFRRDLSPRAFFDARYVYAEGESDLDDDYTSNLIGAGLTYEFR